MRWFRVRKAHIEPEFRETFERYGVTTMQALLSTTNYFQHKNRSLRACDVMPDLFAWLTEQYDRAERKETWSLTMEMAITIFVAAELVLSIIGLHH